MRSAVVAVALLALFTYSGELRAGAADLQIVLAADVSRSITMVNSTCSARATPPL